MTSISLDFLMANKTQLNMQNIATNVLMILVDMNDCRVNLMEYEEHPYETDFTADCILERHEEHIIIYISIHIKPRPTIKTGNDCYLFVTQNEWYPCQTISLMTKGIDDISIKKEK